jgi:hypothetical protein
MNGSRRTSRDNRPAITPDDVYNAICAFAEAHSALPTQSMVANEIGCSQQLVSIMMNVLSDPRDGRIRWLSQRIYFVDKSRWERPEHSEVSTAS